MGILGSLIYPDNAQKATELNKAEDTLRQTNNLHNELVNSYRQMGEKIKNFDSYLMAIMCMHYHLVYTEEDLSNLPAENTPKMSKYWADSVEDLLLDVMTVKMAVDGFKAIKNGIGNLVTESGIFSKTSGEGGNAMQSEVENVGLREPMLRQGEIGTLTTEDAALARELGPELGSVARNVGEALQEEGELNENLEQVNRTAQTTEESAKIAEEGASLSSKLMSGVSAALGPAMLAVTAVMEILSVIHAGQEKSKLEKAQKNIQEAQDKINKSVDSLKKTFKKLLTAGKKDIEQYNKLLPQLKALEHSSMFDRAPFSTLGIQEFIDGLDVITIENTGIPGYEAGAKEDIKAVTDFIREHAVHDSKMTSIIKQLKTHLRSKKLTELKDDDPIFKEIADADSVTLEEVKTYNKFRVFLQEYASVLLPYHQKIQESSTPGKVPKVPEKIEPGKADKSFDPTPDKFKIPGVSS